MSRLAQGLQDQLGPPPAGADEIQLGGLADDYEVGRVTLEHLGQRCTLDTFFTD